MPPKVCLIFWVHFKDDKGGFFCVNIKQIIECIRNGISHYIICHNVEIIKKLKRDILKFCKAEEKEYCGIDLLDKEFSNRDKVLRTICPIYGDNVEVRHDKIDKLKRELQEADLPNDTEIKIDYRGDRIDELVQCFKDKLAEIFYQEDKYYQWSQLLNPRRFCVDDLSPEDDAMAFEDDNWKVINSAAFRRLQDKAQVFPLEKLDYARTRLTHSYECAAIAEELGTRIIDVIEQKSYISPIFYNKLCTKIPVILKTAALLHDMGNPPFGHFGEELIGNWFARAFMKGGVLSEVGNLLDDLKEDFIHFEGNAQLLRILTSLDQENKAFNLTYSLLSVIIKYPTDARHINKQKLEEKKPGYFYSEKESFNKIRNNMYLRAGQRHPLTFLLEAADDISYLTADLQDAYKKDLVTIEQIQQCFSENQCDEVCKQISRLEDAIVKNSSNDGIVAGVKEKNSRVINELHHFLKRIMIEDVVNAFDSKYELIMSGQSSDDLLSINDRTKNINTAIRKMLRKYVYDGTGISQSQISAARILYCILDEFVKTAIDFDSIEMPLTGRIKNVMSFNYINAYKNKINEIDNDNNEDNKNKKRAYYQLLLATDNVCGMTDSYAKEMYKLLNAD